MSNNKNTKKTPVKKNTTQQKNNKNVTKIEKVKEEKIKPIENEIPIKIVEKEKKEEKITKLSSTEKRNKIIKILVSTVVLIAIFVIVFLMANGFLVLNKTKKLENNLTALGKSFYSEFYYEQISTGKSNNEVKNFLEQFKDVGIKISLGNLEKYNDKSNEKIVKELNNAKCDKEKSQVTIYPISSYSKNDYKIKINLNCDTLK